MGIADMYLIVVGGAGCEEMVFAEDNPTPG